MRRPPDGLDPPDLHGRLGVRGLRRREPALLSAATAANAWRNARGGRDRRKRWTGARDALWDLLDPLVAPGARVAVVGSGNGDTSPLRRLAERAQLTLVDLDEAALRRTGRRLRCATVVHDVTDGWADRIVGRDPNHWSSRPTIRISPLPGAPYDLVVGDLFYSQLLYPALLDAEAPDIPQRLRTYGASLTRAVVEGLHASAPTVVHVHDPVGWWDGHTQPHTLEEVLADPALAGRCNGPKEADPRAVLGRRIQDTRVWRWPFKPGVDYLAVGTVAGR